MVHLKFKIPESDKSSDLTRFQTLLMKFAKLIIPEANPDYEDKLDSVHTWLIEFDNDSIPYREIGLDKSSNPIVWLPDEKNYGYWTDHNLSKRDFENHFQTHLIKSEEFEEIWKIERNIL